MDSQPIPRVRAWLAIPVPFGLELRVRIPVLLGRWLMKRGVKPYRRAS